MTDQSKQWIITEQGIKEAALEYLKEAHPDLMVSMVEELAEIIAKHALPDASPIDETIAQLALEIRNLAHRGWLDRPNAEFLFREIGKRAQVIAAHAQPTPGPSCTLCGSPMAFQCPKCGSTPQPTEASAPDGEEIQRLLTRALRGIREFEPRTKACCALWQGESDTDGCGACFMCIEGDIAEALKHSKEEKRERVDLQLLEDALFIAQAVDANEDRAERMRLTGEVIHELIKSRAAAPPQGTPKPDCSMRTCKHCHLPIANLDGLLVHRPTLRPKCPTLGNLSGRTNTVAEEAQKEKP